MLADGRGPRGTGRGRASDGRRPVRVHADLGHLVMAVGVVLPALWSGIVPIMVSAILVGATFTVITMAGFQEGREIGGGEDDRALLIVSAWVVRC